jgi:hypothetical protein
MHIRALHLSLAIAALTLATSIAHAHEPAPTTDTPTDLPTVKPNTVDGRLTDQGGTLAAELLRNSTAAFAAHDYAKAERILLKLADLQPDNFVPAYNLACAQALQGKADEGVLSLVKAVERGFSDIRYLRNDTSLNALRSTPNYARLIEQWPDILLQRRDADIQFNSQLFADNYTNTNLDDLRIVVRSAFNEQATAGSIEQIRSVAKWADTIMPGTLDPALLVEDPWVVVVLPNRTDFMRWLRIVYGSDATNGTSMIGGAYQHDLRRLVSIDLASTLRHEFMHVLHWRVMSRLNQRHPIWIMEGIAALPEDCNVSPEGLLIPATSWRTNTVKNMDRVNAITPLKTLASMPQSRFGATRPLANYAQSRAFFLYLSERDKLPQWFRAYTKDFDKDPTGLDAAAAALALSVPDLERDFRMWIRALEPVPNDFAEGMPSLGAHIESGSGDGPVVRSQRRIPAADGTDGLRLGDVIMSVNNRPTPEMAELVRVLSQLKVGDNVDVEIRRGKLFRTATMKLVAFKRER